MKELANSMMFKISNDVVYVSSMELSCRRNNDNGGRMPLARVYSKYGNLALTKLIFKEMEEKRDVVS